MSEQNKSTIKVGIIGVGTVGCSVVNILKANQDIIAARAGKAIIASKGVVKNLAKDRGIDMVLSDDVDTILEDDDIDIVVELMGGIDEAFEVVKKALEKGKSVVTANKALLAYHRYDLEAIAGDIPFEFEASVAGGIPIIGALREGLTANHIEGMKGIMNGTCNYILTRMNQEDVEYATVLQEAQDLGYAEADPTLDVGGFDAAHKLLILASIAYGVDAKPEDILIEGLENITQEEINFSKEFNYALKLLCIAKRTGNAVELRVHLAFIKSDEMIAKIDGVMNGISVIGDKVGETLYYGAGAGGDATASAVVSNIIDIVRSGKRSPMLGFRNELQENLTLKTIDEIETKYYIRLKVRDEVGVLAKITKIFGDEHISIEKVLQKPIFKNDDKEAVATLLLSTHTCKEVALKKALSQIEQEPFVMQKTFFFG